MGVSLQVFVFEGKVLKTWSEKKNAIHEIIEWEMERNGNRAERDVFHSGLSERLSGEKKRKLIIFLVETCSVTQPHSATKYASVEYVWATVQGSKLHVPLIADFF